MPRTKNPEAASYKIQQRLNRDIVATREEAHALGRSAVFIVTAAYADDMPSQASAKAWAQAVEATKAAAKAYAKAAKASQANRNYQSRLRADKTI